VLELFEGRGPSTLVRSATGTILVGAQRRARFRGGARPTITSTVRGGHACRRGTAHHFDRPIFEAHFTHAGAPP